MIKNRYIELNIIVTLVHVVV